MSTLSIAVATVSVAVATVNDNTLALSIGFATVNTVATR